MRPASSRGTTTASFSSASTGTALTESQSQSQSRHRQTSFFPVLICQISFFFLLSLSLSSFSLSWPAVLHCWQWRLQKRKKRVFFLLPLSSSCLLGWPGVGCGCGGKRRQEEGWKNKNHRDQPTQPPRVRYSFGSIEEPLRSSLICT